MTNSNSKPHAINEGYRRVANDGKTIGERGQSIPHTQNNPPSTPPPAPAPKK